VNSCSAGCTWSPDGLARYYFLPFSRDINEYEMKPRSHYSFSANFMINRIPTGSPPPGGGSDMIEPDGTT
jgi:hypothetical protein